MLGGPAPGRGHRRQHRRTAPGLHHDDRPAPPPNTPASAAPRRNPAPYADCGELRPHAARPAPGWLGLPQTTPPPLPQSTALPLHRRPRISAYIWRTNDRERPRPRSARRDRRCSAIVKQLKTALHRSPRTCKGSRLGPPPTSSMQYPRHRRRTPPRY